MASLNKVQLIGNLGRDPEVRNTPNGQKIVNLNLATSERWKDRTTGEMKERTEWHRIVVFNEHLAEVAEKYLAKGRTVYVEGTLQTRKWTDQSGQERYTTEVVVPRFRGELVLLGSGGGRGDDHDGGQGAAPAARPAPAPSAPRGGAPSSRSVRDIAADLEDDIPFMGIHDAAHRREMARVHGVRPSAA